MNVHPDVNFEELARSTDDFNGAQLKAVCVEAGMLALRRDATEVFLPPSPPLSLSLTHPHPPPHTPQQGAGGTCTYVHACALDAGKSQY